MQYTKRHYCTIFLYEFFFVTKRSHSASNSMRQLFVITGLSLLLNVKCIWWDHNAKPHATLTTKWQLANAINPYNDVIADPRG
jgi:hypothetical protein